MSAMMHTADRPAPVMVRGEGSRLWDDRGRVYLDLVQGWAVNCLGHAPLVLQKALNAQAATLWNASPAYHNARQHDFALGLAASCDLDRVFFCNSGAEANEGAIKLARKWGQLRRAGGAQILTTEGSFHGRTLATMAASGKPGFSDRFPPAVGGFRRVPFGDVEATRAAIREDTVAIMVEPIQGEAGVVVPPAGYLSGLRELCDTTGTLLILDEIQTGMRRTGPLFRHQAENVRPDIMTLGKGLGGGAPLAALLCREEVDCFVAGDQGGTFNGNALMCAVGAAVLQQLSDPRFATEAEARARELRAGLDELVKDGLATGVRGAGMLLALSLPEARGPAVRDTCMADGLLVNAPRPDLLRFMPALNIDAADIGEALEKLRAALVRQY